VPVPVSLSKGVLEGTDRAPSCGEPHPPTSEPVAEGDLFTAGSATDG